MTFSEFRRRFKPGYMLYNFFHKKQLVHNMKAYKKLGINKRYFDPVSSKDFRHLPEQHIPEPSIDDIIKTDIYKNGNEETKASLRAYNDTGYAILHNYLSSDTVDAINKEVSKLIEQGTVGFRYTNKIMFAIHHSEILKTAGTSKELMELLSVLLSGEAKLFQSINFLMGSQQKTHSDSIHMTTYPLGGLLGVWMALEDIGAENGALHYYPGSHRLPYYLNSDYDNEGHGLFIGDKDYTAYEDMLEKKIEEHKIEKKIFEAKKGDVLIWHANLFHGGEPHTNKEKTRKSMVFHYFKEGVVCYHEITQRPALMKIV